MVGPARAYVTEFVARRDHLRACGDHVNLSQDDYMSRCKRRRASEIKYGRIGTLSTKSFPFVSGSAVGCVDEARTPGSTDMDW